MRHELDKCMKSRLNTLPVYEWDDSHEDNEWLCVNYDGTVSHRLGWSICKLDEKTAKRILKRHQEELRFLETQASNAAQNFSGSS